MRTDKTADDRLAAAARQVLDAHSERIDAPVTDALAHARRRALNGRSHKQQDLWWRRPWPLASMGAATAMVLAALLLVRPSTPVMPMAEPFHDLELLTVQADLDLLEELEFMAWVADQWSDAS